MEMRSLVGERRLFERVDGSRDDEAEQRERHGRLTSIAYLARWVSGITSVGLNAVAFVKPTCR